MLKQCPGCLGEFPVKYFVVRNDYHPLCRACRRRASSRRSQRRKRTANAVIAVSERALERQYARTDAALHRALCKRVESRFKQLTSVTRQRIRIMELNPMPSQRTKTAIAVRKALLSRYTQAREEQLERIMCGLDPKDIMDFMR